MSKDHPGNPPLSPKPGALWIDMENTPHVPFFIPIIRDLQSAGFTVILTARDFAQTKELAEKAALPVTIIGGEYGNSAARKSFGILLRALRLAWQIKGRGVALAIGHGSRGLLLAARILRIPSLTLYDYEGASVSLFNRLSTWVMTPDVIPFATLEHLGLRKSKHRTYPGLKEEVYVSDFQPDESIITELGLDPTKIIVTVRPPSGTAHYRADASFQLFEDILALFASRDDVQVILMPRNAEQRAELELRWPGTGYRVSGIGTAEKRGSSRTNTIPDTPYPIPDSSSFVIPQKAIDGLNLLEHSDIVIGGGGTMNREAAAMGVPVISIFKGPEGAVDRGLIAEKRMIAIDKADEIVPFLHKRVRTPYTDTHGGTTPTRTAIVQCILRLTQSDG